METLQLKHICGYLPYGLKVRFEGCDMVHEMVGLDITSQGMHLISPYGDFGRCNIEEAKPLLRSLSSLTKEVEHNGERFVPMVELYKIARGRYKDSIIRHYSVMATNSIMVEMEGYRNFIFSIVKSESDIRIENPYNFQLHSTNLHQDDAKSEMVLCWNTLFEKLYEWHFDVFGLIDKNLAINLEEI